MVVLARQKSFVCFGWVLGLDSTQDWDFPQFEPAISQSIADIVLQCGQMIYNMYIPSQDFGNLGGSSLLVHNNNIWLGLFLDQILLLLVVVLSLKNFCPPLAEGIVVVEDTDSVDIGAKDIVVVDIVLVDIEQADTEVVLIQLAFVHDFSLIRYSSFSLAAAEVLCNISHHDLRTCKIYNRD